MEPEGRLEGQALHAGDVRRWQGEWVFDESGEAVGKISDVLVDAESKPEWMIVSFGSFLHEDRLVPVFDIKPGDHGLIVSYAKDLVQSAPVVSVESMSDEDEAKLMAYWCATRSAAMPRACSLLGRA
jgi:hypothetical protein